MRPPSPPPSIGGCLAPSRSLLPGLMVLRGLDLDRARARAVIWQLEKRAGEGQLSQECSRFQESRVDAMKQLGGR